MDKFLFGRYIPGHSWVHRLDPRAKLVLCFMYVLVVFFANNLWTYLLLTVLLLASVAATAISLRIFLRGLRPLLWLLIFTVLIQVFFGAGGHVYWSWGILSVTHDGLISAGLILMRFVLIIMISTLLTFSTAPLDIADGIESLLSPLRKVHFPVATLALMLSLALRFVPTLMDEAEKIMNAQRARGVDFGTGGLKQQIKTIVPILIPLFVNAFNRAVDISTAMEARGYQDGENRTKYRQLKWQRADTISFLVYVVSLASVIGLRFVA
ncbi:energy-coupling factor transporter transmembrane protein EcfT [Secundilactobacillus similis DSM 23365 = JCM 2765]|uniref:Energy-coupling factor transporter transmembrane protein EcfT n=1 Tax=Secundilactobacillus similis DSM 23365 = JCM 2765 TaxID=1423804 RepID=A0A0R2FFL4_9LACO|nr:energy-coupling factor transporter transmembrane component T [Secundilactobacillus similis]KRN23850.1 ABC-type cobalt transport system, permease component CbiQ related transporter [Secundilactobacillus similis DSM 23365 = JCM 2765]